eukprot:SAG11_NODE_32235_length_285_cov_0.983871_1_plen_26_part_10
MEGGGGEGAVRMRQSAIPMEDRLGSV